MQYFTVEVWANMPMNQGEKDYSQMYRAINNNEKCVAEHYEANNKIGNEFIYHVTDKRFIKANTGQGAIFKFQKWRAEGLDDSWLSSDFS